MSGVVVHLASLDTETDDAVEDGVGVGILEDVGEVKCGEDEGNFRRRSGEPTNEHGYPKGRTQGKAVIDAQQKGNEEENLRGDAVEVGPCGRRHFLNLIDVGGGATFLRHPCLMIDRSGKTKCGAVRNEKERPCGNGDL